jgi:site-specific DNA-adenine methylase
MRSRWESPDQLAKHLGRHKYGGQSKATKHILPLLPKGTKIVEPFAGHAFVSLKAKSVGMFEKVVLGDKNCGALSWVKKHRKTENVISKCQDWRATVRQHDAKDTVFVFDPPWKAVDKCYTAYKGNCTNFAPQIVEMAKHLKGKSVLLVGDTPEHRKVVCKSRVFVCHKITVDSKIFGNKSEWQEIVAVRR